MHYFVYLPFERLVAYKKMYLSLLSPVSIKTRMNWVFSPLRIKYSGVDT